MLLVVPGSMAVEQRTGSAAAVRGKSLQSTDAQAKVKATAATFGQRRVALQRAFKHAAKGSHELSLEQWVGGS